MYPFGHVGIGVHLVPARVRRNLAFRWLALGCLLPDLIDKPAWLLLRAAHKSHGGTRLFGHTLLFCAMLALGARLLRSPALRALFIGALTHVLLDAAGEVLSGMPSIWTGWLFWPLFGQRFPVEANLLWRPDAEMTVYLLAEAAGFLLLARDGWRWWRSRASNRADSPAGSAAGSARHRRTSA